MMPVHPDPLDVGNGNRSAYISFRLHKNGNDSLVALLGKRNGYFIQAYPGITHGVLGQKRDDPVAAQNAAGNLVAPDSPIPDLVGIKPHRVTAQFKIGLNALNEWDVGVAGVTEKNIHEDSIKRPFMWQEIFPARTAAKMDRPIRSYKIY